MPKLQRPPRRENKKQTIDRARFAIFGNSSCLTLWGIGNLVKGMKVSEKFIQRLVHQIFKDLKAQNIITFKEKEDHVFHRACEILVQEYQRESDLDREVHRMMDDLEIQSPGEFQRYKMFPLLKKKLAKEKGIVL